MNFRVLFLLYSVFFAALFVGVLAHEATHLALADEAHGVCIGRCYTFRDGVPGWSFASAHGVHNELSMGEALPGYVGLLSSVAFAWAGFVAIFERRRVLKMGKKKKVEDFALDAEVSLGEAVDSVKGLLSGLGKLLPSRERELAKAERKRLRLRKRVDALKKRKQVEAEITKLEEEEKKLKEVK